MSVDELKARGNDAFKKGNFMDSARLYSEAILLDPAVSVLYSNKAMAYLNLKDYQGALTTCNQGLLQTAPDDKTKVKLLWRKATALRELLRFEEAKTCLHSALEIDPSNQTVINDLQLVNSKITESESEWIEIPIEKVRQIPPGYLPEAKMLKLDEVDLPQLPQPDNFPASPSALFLTELSRKPENERKSYYNYVIQLDNSVYTSLFAKSGIDSAFLEFFLEASINYLQSDQSLLINNIVNHVQSFVKTPRFSIASMFIPSSTVDTLFALIEQKTSQNLKSIWN
ncbi:hypothetical protein OGAPHI_003648 [Ogataea philodendri]|uniref:RNA polymerase II-associated protein 3 n=1 Tax=Ogataea philodendri TaxID=1378263 RepID=A0A9P8T4P6_9ASCO|nr:uncharacterized protein OGAPHI_003648 [Ogataea philodendri]KAH3665464.1 hypothetical protein OGAPHI_003648 [Ogataea philodendri]